MSRTRRTLCPSAHHGVSEHPNPPLYLYRPLPSSPLPSQPELSIVLPLRETRLNGIRWKSHSIPFPGQRDLSRRRSGWAMDWQEEGGNGPGEGHGLPACLALDNAGAFRRTYVAPYHPLGDPITPPPTHTRFA